MGEKQEFQKMTMSPAAAEAQGLKPQKPVPLYKRRRVRVAPNHVCTAVNLVDELHVGSGASPADRWSVIARGANS